ncbi:MAG TPA: tetratricopeptide repeat protein [Stellaceae bacterium]|nr:tetratricopeptide repeat protein [Stellaceae bacterium]
MADPPPIPAPVPELAPEAGAAPGGQPGAQFPPEAAAGAPSAAERLDRLVAAATEHEQAGRLDPAEAILRQVIAEAPERHGAVELLGIVCFRKGRIAEAAQLMERALAQAPRMALYHRNICEVYRTLGRFDEALAAGRRAASLAPNDAHCYHNLSVLHYHRLELDEAIAAAERAVALDANFPGAHFGIAEAALLRADFARGWEEYEWRFKLGNAPPLMPPTDRPQWDGSPLPDQRLLLIADQGYGDVIQFARYVPWAKARCADIALACSAEIEPLVQQLSGLGSTFSHWEHKPDFAAFCALSSLPRLAGTRLETIPADIVPYLRADPDRRAAWGARLAAVAPAGHRRIGIAWAGRPSHHNDRNRSTGLAAFAPLAALPRTTLLSLQKGGPQAQIGTYWGSAPLVNLGPEIRDFADTMAIIDNLDLVVSVDTSIVHLAGAMGRPVWAMLPYAPDWRWLLGRGDSPWYPSLRLFRQGKDRSFAPVIADIAGELGAGH